MSRMQEWMLRGYLAARERMTRMGRTMRKKDGLAATEYLIILCFVVIILNVVLPKLREMEIAVVNKMIEAVNQLFNTSISTL